MKNYSFSKELINGYYIKILYVYMHVKIYVKIL